MADFHFLYPGWLLCLLLIPLMWAWVMLRRREVRGWQEIVDPELAPFVLTGQERRLSLMPLILFSLLSALAILAVAGPAWVKKEVPVFREQQALVVALDLSASMYAQDVSPSRLEQARFKLIDLLKLRKDGQTGLVVFAGDAFAVSPLTDDTKTIEAQMKSLTPEIMPAQGSQADRAILRSIDLLQQAGAHSGAILLMTDGSADPVLTAQAVKDAVSKGYSVSVLAFGTEAGAPIALANGGFLADANGQTVMAGLDKDSLRAISLAGNGLYVDASLSDDDVNQLSAQWAGQNTAADLVNGGARQIDTWVNEGLWLVLLMLPLALLSFRRGWLAVLAVILILPQTDPVQAASWSDLWQTPDQQAQSALQAGQAQQASQLFENPDWKAAAAYKSGDFKLASELYAQSAGLEGRYNLGNALARQERIPEAIAAYEQVLKEKPDHADARYNLELLKKKQEEQQQNQEGQSGEQSQQQNSQNQEGQNGQQSQQNGQPQDNAEQQEQQSKEQQAQDEQQKKEQQAKNQNGKADEQQPDDKTDNQADQQMREQKQATEQWLRRIPDDPAGLWRRKFQYQYQQRARPSQGGAW